MKNEAPTAARSARRYAREFSLAMVIYGITVIAVGAWLRGHPDSPWRIPVALLPFLPVMLGFVALARFFGRMDELMKRVQLEGMAFAFSGTVPLVIGYGFLESAGLPKLSMWWVWVTMAMLWFAGSLLASRRYR